MSSDPREPTTEGYSTYETTLKAASYVTEILEHEARLNAHAVSPTRRRRSHWAFGLAVPLFLLLTATNLISAGKAVPRLAPELAKREAQVGIYLAIQQIESYKQENDGQLPPTLEEVGADAPGLVFVRDVQGYEIVAEIDGAYERYRDGDDTARFEAAAASLFGTDGGPR